MSAAAVIKPFVDSFDYSISNTLAADETNIKVKGITHYVWFVMDAIKKSLGYHVSESRDVGPCILTMRMAFEKFKAFSGKTLSFISDGYSAYMQVRRQFLIHKGWDFDVMLLQNTAGSNKLLSVLIEHSKLLIELPEVMVVKMELPME